jgi:galactokinase/mevalonate kinase-like predicted kinase
MHPIAKPWDFLIVTASNAAQASAYQAQLALRRELGLLAGVEQVLVVADPPLQRIGSGGSTVLCLCEVLARVGVSTAGPSSWLAALRQLRVLIVHAGGDSRRLPAYGPCGKIFIPVPGESDSAIAPTLFDRQIEAYLALPPMPGGVGQIVITAGDVLLGFDPSAVRFADAGITGLGSHAAPEQAAKHGVYCTVPGGNATGGRVRLYLQKPSVDEQQRQQAIDRYGQSVLDIGVIAFDAATAVGLLESCGVQLSPNADGKLAWSGEVGTAIQTLGLDFYREICCALGRDVTPEHHRQSARGSGSKWSDALLESFFQAFSPVPFTAQVLPHCSFLHFGTTRQIIDSGVELLLEQRGVVQSNSVLSINNDIRESGGLVGREAWVEGCTITAPLTVAGENVVVGLEVNQPLSLPAGAAIDVQSGRNRAGRPVWFVRCYGTRDGFKESIDAGATFCNRPMSQWLELIGAKPADVWPVEVPESQRSLWNARVFPAVRSVHEFSQWIWMFDPIGPAVGKSAWLNADRYSSAEILELAEPDAFYERRSAIRAGKVSRSLRRLFRLGSGFSAADLARVLIQSADPPGALHQILTEARWYHRENGEPGNSLEAFVFARIIHSLGQAVESIAPSGGAGQMLSRLDDLLTEKERLWLGELQLLPGGHQSPLSWAQRAQSAAFDDLGRTIISGEAAAQHPVQQLRSDEIVWGRAPARLDLGGGWSDTPPYSLEHGGSVVNAAIDLNGQPPIHCYGRVIPESVIRIGSIDLGTRIELTELGALMDFRKANSEYGLVKAALALSGFSPDAGRWPEGITLAKMLELFGGGIELTTLAAVPKGSGLGTSSIMGAVICSVIARMMGRQLTQRELFYSVLKLEQALTTGGGWQDQIGGVVDAVKVVTTDAGLIPDARVHYVPADVLDPHANGGCTLLYYTGITRLAKNILQQVVGRYLNRDRQAMATLKQIRALPPLVADAMSRKDLAGFGELIDVAWRLNKQLDPNSTTPEIDSMLQRVRTHIHGAKLLGAGGGGFLLMVARSPADAAAIRRMLEESPPNPRARFFEFSLNRTGLAVNVC